MHKALITYFFLIIINSLKAQYSKGNDLFEKGFYAQSIPYFQKARSGKEADNALEKMAQAYLKLRKFDEAEKYYAQLIQKTNVKPIHYFEYGEALMGNSKYEEAKKQFKTYSKLNPSDKRGELMAKACQDIQLLINQQPKFSVYSIPSVNSNGDDFCPQITPKGLVLISDRPVSYDYTKATSYKAEQKLNILLAEKPKNTNDSLFYNLPKIYSPVLNKAYYNGPVSFNEQYTYMAYTRVELLRSNKNKVNRPQIYFAENKGYDWFNVTPFPYNSPNYSCMHPALSPDGKTLVFASDMEDSEGGMDLYISEKQGDVWSKPKNLGKNINTPLNEVFPYFSPSGTLYFSSNGHGGHGGLDIFATSLENGSWTTPVNLLSPLNSSYDDFGIVFDKEERRGFFSSNRPGGLGKDDIYGFYFSNKKITIAGKVLLSENLNDGAANIKLLLVTEDGTIVQTTSTDKSGYFKFVNLPEDKKYLLKIDENDTSLESFKKIYLADQNNQIRKKTTTDDKGVFTFYNLPLNPDLMKSDIEDDTRIAIIGSLLYGENPAKPLTNQNIVLLNDKGEVIAKGQTDTYGSFKFIHLPPEQNYYVAIEGVDTKLAPNTRIIVTDNKGKTIRTLFADAKGAFKFDVLASESNTLRVLEEEDTSLRIEYKGKLFTNNNNQEPLANTKVQLIDSKGKVIQTAITDAEGNFKFTNLPFDKNFFLSVEEQDVPANIKQVYIADEKGKIIRKLIFEKGKFNFEILPEDKQKLATIYVEDPWLKMKEIKENKKDSITVIENIYYEYGKWNITADGAKVLDKVVNIMKENPNIFIELSSHTDSRSSAEFNLELSRKRAKSAVDYILSKGIEKHRITGVGMGETKLVNYCADGVECTEEQHAQNRRTEFKVVKQKIN
jgi:outer membrane protein OmpA-like peptidoglycan-associated protein/tetratricopeptide (TPR) repeat protein